MRSLVFLTAVALFIGSCQHKTIDPNSVVPVFDQLEKTSWVSIDGSNYILEIKKERIKVRLGGILGLAETPFFIKVQDTNFVLATLYEETPNPFLIAVSIVDNNNIKVYIWAYEKDILLEDAKKLLKVSGKIFRKR